MSKKKDLEFVREQLRKAAEIKDPRDMWYALRDILILLSMLIVPTEHIEVASLETVTG